MTAIKKIIFLGTGSDVGKSITATAFCRILKNRGLRVAPFKAQNMSNNAYVTLGGGEIGRAQAAQAEAAGCLPSVDMNPVLLKPCSEIGSQVVVLGQVRETVPARDYYGFKQELKKTIVTSFNRLAGNYEAIVMEGAGSCAEVNLRDNDLVNFDMALAVDAPVILVADIDRGGVFAQIIGTLEIISPAERDRVAGFIINKFRGDPGLFEEGIAYLERRTGKPVLGLVPWLQDIAVDTEDSMSLDAAVKTGAAPVPGRINIGVVRVPHVSNFTDIQALEQEPEVAVTWLEAPENLDRFQAIIIPGSKSVISDLIVLKENGWAEALARYVKDQRKMVVGLCGGYQMLGRIVEDPLGVEGSAGSATGLGMLNTRSRLEAVKQVRQSAGRDRLFGVPVSGYEIHMGQTALEADMAPLLDLEAEDGQTTADGAVAENKNVLGTYLHGLFDSGAFRSRFLSVLAGKNRINFDAEIVRPDYWRIKDKNYDRLAGHFEAHTDVQQVLEIMAGRGA